MNLHLSPINILTIGIAIFFFNACGDKYSIDKNKDNISATPTPVAINSNKIGKLKISKDKRMLEYEDGRGFFWMGDTAWEMPRALTRENTVLYLKNRKEIGFNVIQMSAVNARYKNGDFPDNVYGEKPFDVESGQTPDFSKFNENYWKHIDYMIDTAADKDLYIALLPAWEGVIPDIDSAEKYGKMIAQRYKDRKNIIWVVGGDSNADNGKNKEIWSALGQVIKENVGSAQLVTYHPSGGKSSSEWFKDASWLDFHMLQSGHCSDMKIANELFISEYKKNIDKPVMDAEPRYETIQSCFAQKTKGERFSDKDVREIAYRQLFSGAFGHTYGHQSIWQIYKGGNDTFDAGDAPIKTWEEALNDPGAIQMGYISRLMKSRPIVERIPDQSMVQNGDAIATRGIGYAFIYLPKGGSITVNLGKISSSEIKAWWYNPKTGDATEIGTYKNNGTKSFNSSGSDDIVLVLDDVSKGYDTPGL